MTHIDRDGHVRTGGIVLAVKGVKILGISGSPRVNGNTSMLVKQALSSAAEIEGVETAYADLSGDLKPCIDCDKCPVDPPDKYCIFGDKISRIYQMMIDADGIILASPAYFGTVTAQMKMLMDRCRPLGRAGSLLRYKVGGAISVGACRSGGQEKALGTIVDHFILTGMLPVGLTRILQVGVSGLAWREGNITDDSWRAEFLPEGEVTWVHQCRELGRSVAAVSMMVAAGRKVVDPGAYVEGWKIDKNAIH